MSVADEGLVVVGEAHRSSTPANRRGRSVAQPASYAVLCTERGEVSVVANGAVATLTSRTYINDLPIAEAFGDVVPAECADLVDVAIAVYVADRLCRRHPRTAPRAEPLWQRRMHVEVPMREPERWRDGLGGPLARLLSFLTDDVWTFTFVPRSGASARPSESQRSLFLEPPPSPASAALFSGGLDSLAGLVARLVEHPAETVILFCGRTNKRIGSPQRVLLEELARTFPQRVHPISVGFGMNGRRRGAFDREETSQRTRGFVFQAFGAVTARMAGLDRLDVYENGVGAINLGYTDAQLGSQATRATHPATLQLMSTFLAGVFGAPFAVALPYAFVTKGELCNAMREAGLGRLARRSVSCDGFPQRSKLGDQCGVCPSCLLRRQSLHYARLVDDDPTSLYIHDVYDASAPNSYERRFALRAMGGQVHHLRRALASEHPWEALAARYPDLEQAADALSGSDGGAAVREALVALYRRYCAEWGAFSASTMGSRDGAPNRTPALGVEVQSMASGRVIAPSAPPIGARYNWGIADLWAAVDLGGPYHG
jgi:hypothetical protein